MTASCNNCDPALNKRILALENRVAKHAKQLGEISDLFKTILKLLKKTTPTAIPAEAQLRGVQVLPSSLIEQSDVTSNSGLDHDDGSTNFIDENSDDDSLEIDEFDELTNQIEDLKKNQLENDRRIGQIYRLLLGTFVVSLMAMALSVRHYYWKH